ncbi:MAG: metallophosphoesterase [Spirochaetes bacterium]|nr:metallophosphoesterase [Spirochaetota bacterium]
MIKILLTSDLHLGDKPDKNHASYEDRMIVFSNIIENAMIHDILLISGDLFHNFEPDEELIGRVNELFCKLKDHGTQIVILPGEHEIQNNEISENLKNLDADILFGLHGDEINTETLEIKNEKIIFYPHPSPDERILSQVRKSETAGFHLGVFHIDLNEQNMKNNLFTYIQKEDHLDFYALGHDHNLKIFKYQNRIIAAFPGAPHIMDDSDLKTRHVLSLTVENGRMTDIKRLAISAKKTISLEFDCSFFKSTEEILNKIKPYSSEKTRLHLTLTGNRIYEIDTDFLNSVRDLFYQTEITNNSVTDIQNFIKESYNDNSLKGEFFNALSSGIQSDSDSFDNEIIAQILSKFPIEDSQQAEEWVCSLINA